jgi:N-acetylmuramoyl-L-alanine amidase
MFIESLLWLSLNIYHEARGEDKLAQVAVAHVTLNRGPKIKKEVLKPYAFSWTHQKECYFPRDLKAYLESVHSAYIALQGHDFTGGADHYHHIKIKPWWRNKMTYVGTYGSHAYYRPMVKLKAKKKLKFSPEEYAMN